MTIQEIQKRVRPILLKHKVTQAALFGSIVRNETNPTSDVDILVEFGNPISLLNYVGIKLELEEQLGRKVDLVEYKAIKPALRKNILSDNIRIV
ncbi:MAG: nucleotidyltransferase family protein [Ignavibacteriales bacterium]|nr:nucleotidyltransferase family protein [Ignavibacteriales bacterium]